MRSLYQTTSSKKRNILIAVVSVFIIALISVATFCYLKQKDENYRAKQYGSSQTNPVKDTPTATSKGSVGGSSSSKDASSSPATTAAPGIMPTTPTGVFVSNHHPNLSGQPAPNLESSTCSTTPGVSCQISFTNGDVTRSLEARVTNTDGNTSWTWKLSDIGLTVGDWKITAVATNGSKVTTAGDSMPLSIKQ